VVIVVTLAPMRTAWAAEAWVLWVEAPVGSDQWSIAGLREARFKAKEECERMTGDARDVFTCLPDTVDPRPEGALR
jgi:hypothetical protein